MSLGILDLKISLVKIIFAHMLTGIISWLYFNKTFIFLRKSFSKSLVYLPIYFSLIWQKIWPSSLQSIYCWAHELLYSTSVPVLEI